MTSAREQARENATRAVAAKPYERGNHDIIAADAASDVWEPLLQNATEEVKDLAAKVQYLVDFCNEGGLLEEGDFTFPDGDTWEAR